MVLIKIHCFNILIQICNDTFLTQKLHDLYKYEQHQNIMSRRIIENMIDEELTFIIVSKQMEDRDVITNLLFQYGYPLTFYRADLYKELNNDLFYLFDNPSYPAIFIRGKYIGNTQDLQYLLQADIELSSDGEMTIEE